MIDMKKVKEGIKLPLVIGIALLVLMYLIVMGLAFLIPPGTDALTSQIIGGVVLVLPYVFFLPFFIWTGYRSVKKYNAYLAEAGIIAAIVAGLIKIIEFIATIILILVMVFLLGSTLGPATTEGTQGEIGEALGSMAALGGVLLLGGILINTLTCAIYLAFTIPINFLVGILGGYIAGQKKFSEEKKPGKPMEKKASEKK